MLLSPWFIRHKAMCIIRVSAPIALLLFLAPALAAEDAQPVPRRVYAHLLDPARASRLRPPGRQAADAGTPSATAPTSPACAGSGSRTTGSSATPQELDRYTRDARPGRRHLAVLPDPVREEPGRPGRRDQAARPLPVRRLGLRARLRARRLLAAVPAARRRRSRPLEARLGDRWLGTDIGEQDGRYIGGYADQMTPASAARFEQYLNFQRHFERMSDDLGHRHATLVSLNFGHYLLKEGTLHPHRGRDGAGAAQQPGLLRLHPRGRQAVWRPLVRQCVGLQPLGLQVVWRPGGQRRRFPRAHQGVQPQPAEAAAVQPHPLQQRGRGVRERLVRGRQALADRPHPAVGPCAGLKQTRPARA